MEIKSSPAIGSLELQRDKDFYLYEWLNAYPNPFSEMLSFELDLREVGVWNNNIKITIWSASGVQRHHETYYIETESASSQISLDLSGYENGVYIVRVHLGVRDKYIRVVKS